MALFSFTKAMIEGKPIDIYNEGKMLRDFTYIDDIVEAIIKIINKPATADPNFDTNNPNSYSSFSPYRVFNVGNNSPVNLLEYINTIEKKLGITALKNLLPMQPGDVASTAADTTKLFEWINFKPATSTEIGVSNFINWYKQYYNI
jgi:UDP-glucuronate 4-epimerase